MTKQMDCFCAKEADGNVKPIVKDIMFLGQKSELATADDRQIITDLQDTLKAHQDGCVGMAANMIGYKKRIIIVSMGSQMTGNTATCICISMEKRG